MYANIKSGHKISDETFGKLKAPLKAKYVKHVEAKQVNKPKEVEKK